MKKVFNSGIWQPNKEGCPEVILEGGGPNGGLMPAKLTTMLRIYVKIRILSYIFKFE